MKRITTFVPTDGCFKFIEENYEVLVAGFGRKGHAVGDIPGVPFKVVNVAMSLFGPYYTKARREAKTMRSDGENTIVINFHMP